MGCLLVMHNTFTKLTDQKAGKDIDLDARLCVSPQSLAAIFQYLPTVCDMNVGDFNQR
jgi:hypothetical protein